jgi:predicted acyl esterase
LGVGDKQTGRERKRERAREREREREGERQRERERERERERKRGTIKNRLSHTCHVVVAVTTFHVPVLVCVGWCLWVLCPIRQGETRRRDIHSLVVPGGIEHIHEMWVITIRLPYT